MYIRMSRHGLMQQQDHGWSIMTTKSVITAGISTTATIIKLKADGRHLSAFGSCGFRALPPDDGPVYYEATFEF
jgi:hypothetical protein